MSPEGSSGLGFAGMGQTAIGGLTGAIGSTFGGSAQKAMYDYQAGIARLNQQIAAQNAEYAIQVGEIQAEQAGMKGGQQLGAIRAAQGASGLDVRSGSAAQVQASQKLVTAMDLTAIRSNAAKTAYNYQVQGVQFGAEAQLDTMAGRNAQTAGIIGGLGSIIGTAGSVASQWLRGQQLGMFGGTALGA